ncbi:MAG: hypothetical protein IT548_02340 [Alphaproteobacteria bacterium]|nr:hypothetical protein [Alphaproteobacteria bacterium]
MTAINKVFQALAGELEHAREMTLRVEGAVCDLSHHIPPDASMLDGLQQLDKVVQHLAALRDYVAALSGHDGAFCPDRAATAANRITLHDVRSRLGGGLAGAGVETAEVWEEV